MPNPFKKMGDFFKKVVVTKPKRRTTAVLVSAGLVALDESFGLGMSSGLIELIAEAVAAAAN